MMTASGATRVHVVHVGATGRSGTTVLARALGQLDGVFAAGELCYVGAWGLVERRPCGCGAPVRSCRVWGDILERAFPGCDLADLGRHLAEHQRRLERARYAALLATPRGWPHLARLMGDLPSHQAALVRSAAEVTGCRVVVDTSKPLVHGAVLAAMPGVELTVLHLVRDPRATAFSLQRLKPPDIPDKVPPLRSALVWAAWNAAAPALAAHPGVDRWIGLRYEDLVRSPRQVVGSLVDGLGLAPGRAVPFLDERTVRFAPDHTVAGNSNRHSVGDVRLEPDDEWATAMTMRARTTVTVASALTRRRYGYRWSHSAR